MTTSFLRLRKPWLQYRQDFEDLPYLADLYDFWSLVWAADTKEKSDLPYWEHEIKSNSLAYVRVGLSLQIVRSKLAYGNKKWRHLFEEFCRNSPAGSIGYANQIIKAAQITLDLINQGFKTLPSCVAQALPLARFSSSLGKANKQDSHKEISQKWQEVIDTAPNGQITAALVKTVVNGEPEEPKKAFKVGKHLKDALIQEARARGISTEEMLEEILAERYKEKSESARAAAEQEEILDQLDAEFQQSAAPAEAIAPTTKPVAGFGCQKPSRNPQKAINNRSDQASDSS
jgi:hypothetical protein